jgi:sodium/bile acid cotransporter 7
MKRPLRPVPALLKKYWFMVGLVAVAAVTMADRYEWTVAAGRWLKAHQGPGMVIFAIFFFSGLALDVRLLKKGLGDGKATAAALASIFIFAPMVAWVFRWLPLDHQIITGLFLVAVMPSTLSSGVVMTGGAGGNAAHALLVTIIANALAVFTIPVVLSLLLATTGDNRLVVIDKAAIMIKIALLVLVPLALGMAAQYFFRRQIAPWQGRTQVINQLLILAIVWMAMCQSRAAILAGSHAIISISAATLGFHLVLVALAASLAKCMRIGPGRRESIIFMGGQKTLPLSVILQVTLFPEYGLALAVCVVHHILHLITDAYLVEKLKHKA